jgi:2-polyprenyl-3-methyl-5-hydroxy-6-metoxy-1,4-benzoquinol methylase
MIEEILSVAKEATYDFQKTANPDDPLKYLFPEWVSYYRTKWAIAHVLKPKSILEVGVRFGYSALAFLDAVPSARYTGIDIDSALFGGTVGAIEWARNACKQYQVEFIIGDSTKMERFPGERHDLIHIDGQQDGQGTMHDLVLAAAQGRYILVDGYFWSRQNFLWASEFLFRYRDIIEFYHVLPGYAGELLIKTKIEEDSSADGPIISSAMLQSTYTKKYYLSNCGGYEAFKRSFGAKLEDNRLDVVARLCALAPSGRALDLGCGRGELSLELARLGFKVTAIDYSKDAVEIAREAISRNPKCSSAISLECNDVNRVELQGAYNVAVAADLIEHMLPTELDQLYQRLAEHLAHDGLFVVHTYPNLWYYKYEYARRLRLANQIGAYLPAEPRTRYELLMHANEQSPRVLKRQLSQHFKYVLLWFGTPNQAGENLYRRFSIQEIRAAPDLFAVASHTRIPVEKFLSALRMETLPLEAAGKIRLRVVAFPGSVRTSGNYSVSVLLENGTDTDLKSLHPHPIHLSYHWLDTEGQCLMFEGERTCLLPDARSRSSQQYEVSFVSPSRSGTYILRLTLLQEGIRWFDQLPANVYCDVPVKCESSLAPFCSEL